MKVHLLNPDLDLSMCGLGNAEAENFTRRPEEADCKTCRKFYEANVAWWWTNYSGSVPVTAHYSAQEDGIPGLFLTLISRR